MPDPQITAPASATVQCLTDVQAAVDAQETAFQTAGATTSCGLTFVVAGAFTETDPCATSVTVTYTLTDQCNRTATTTQTINIVNAGSADYCSCQRYRTVPH